MGRIIHVDFRKRAVQDTPVPAPSPTRTVTPQAAPGDPALAHIMILGGTFRDSTIFSAQPHGHGFRLLQFAPEVTPETLAAARPVARLYAGEDALTQYFRPLAARETLYTLAIRNVYVILRGGQFAPRRQATPRDYRRGDVVVEMASGACHYGPAAMMLPRLVPLDDEGRAALAHARAHTNPAVRSDGSPFSFDP